MSSVFPNKIDIKLGISLDIFEQFSIWISYTIEISSILSWGGKLHIVLFSSTLFNIFSQRIQHFAEIKFANLLPVHFTRRRQNAVVVVVTWRHDEAINEEVKMYGGIVIYYE